MKYLSQPVVIEVMHWLPGTYADPDRHTDEVVAWVNDNGGEADYEAEHPTMGPATIAVRTHSGVRARITAGGFVVRKRDGSWTAVQDLTDLAVGHVWVPVQ